jgi:ribonuclease VapC
LILDSSALIAVVREELGHDRVVKAIEGAAQMGIGTPTLVESSIVLVHMFGLQGRSILSRFLEENGVITVPFDDRHWRLSSEAFIRYGKGRHPAALNYGDCMTYATAKVADSPLLYVGDDFAKTDLAPA